MKKFILTIFVMILGIILCDPVYGEECYTYPSAKEIDVKVNAFVNLGTNGFKYEYSLNSSSKSVQDVWNFMIEILPNMIPESPFGWIGKKIEGGDYPVFSWFSASPGKNVKPGMFLDGFIIKSLGLPTITTYYVAGWYEPERFTEGMAPDEDCPGQDIFTNAVQGKTIGPTAPPADFKPLDFLNYIIDLKHQAFSLGWIKERGIEESLDAKLENARKKIEEGNTVAAKNILEALINEVEAQGCESYENCPSGKHLTSEAYALLKYNVRYLIEKLK